MLRILLLLTLLLFSNGCSKELWLEKAPCFIENKSTIDTWVHVASQSPFETILPLSLIQSNIQEFAYTAMVRIDRFKINNVDVKSREKRITYHAQAIKTFKGEELREIKFSKTIDIDEQICLESTIAGHELLISLEKYKDGFYGPDVGCVSRITTEMKQKLSNR